MRTLALVALLWGGSALAQDEPDEPMPPLQPGPEDTETRDEDGPIEEAVQQTVDEVVDELEPEADETPPLQPDDTEEDDIPEIVVWGDAAVQDARSAIVRKMEDLGWKARDRGGMTVFRPPKPWMGKARLSDSGLLFFGRPVVALASGPQLVEDPDYSADAMLDRNDRAQTVIGPGGQQATAVGGSLSFHVLPAKRRVADAQARVLEAITPELRQYRAVVQRTAFEQWLNRLPEQLDALWASGTPLDPDEDRLETVEDRKAAVLEFWASRASTPEGLRATKAVEAWLSAVVQGSDTPLTEGEIARAEALRDDGRKLDL